MTNTQGNRQYNKLRNAIKGIMPENLSGLEFSCFSVSPDGDRGLFPTLLRFTQEELTDFLQRMALY